jgi:hypothetical protein
MIKDFTENENGQAESFFDLSILVPRTGFEPAHPCERCHLKAVRLPISPSGHCIQECKYSRLNGNIKIS